MRSAWSCWPASSTSSFASVPDREPWRGPPRRHRDRAPPAPGWSELLSERFLDLRTINSRKAVAANANTLTLRRPPGDCESVWGYYMTAYVENYPWDDGCGALVCSAVCNAGRLRGHRSLT